MSTKSNQQNKDQQGKGKRFPPVFWVAFIALIIFNLSVFFDYSKPLDRYVRFAKVHHLITLKGGSVLHNIDRQGAIVEQCTLASQSVIEWRRVEGNEALYVLSPESTAQGVQTYCLPGDIIPVDFTSEDNPNTLLMLLSIDFDNPFKGAK
ncbi:MAG: hypothetical protein ACI8WB_004857 [Phenylobacterium sp.]|jgi:hypothetical protein